MDLVVVVAFPACVTPACWTLAGQSCWLLGPAPSLACSSIKMLTFPRSSEKGALQLLFQSC